MGPPEAVARYKRIFGVEQQQERAVLV